MASVGNGVPNSSPSHRSFGFESRLQHHLYTVIFLLWRCELRTARITGPILATAVTFLAGCSDPTESPDWQVALDYADSEIHAIAIGKQGYPFIEIQVNGRAVEVLLDTGNMTGLFLAGDVIRRLGLPELGEVVTRDSDGNSTGTKPTYAAASVTAFDHRFADREILQRNQRDLDGAIGPPYLAGRRYTLDYRSRRLGVTTNPVGDPPPGAERLDLVPVEGLAGMIVVRGQVAGREVYIQVDTGKTRTCVDPEFARQAGLHETANGYRIDSLEIGSQRFAVPSAKGVGFGGISDGLDAPILVAIGSDVLKEIVLTVDVDRATVFIQRH